MPLRAQLWPLEKTLRLALMSIRPEVVTDEDNDIEPELPPFRLTNPDQESRNRVSAYKKNYGFIVDLGFCS